MHRVVDFLDAARRQVRVNLRRAQALVAQQFLHRRRSAPWLSMCVAKRMPQRVRADIRVEPGFSQVLVQLPADRAGAQALAVLVDEDARRRACLFSRACAQSRGTSAATLSGRRPSAKFVPCLPLPRTRGSRCREVHILHVQPDELADADARGIQRFEHRLVACREQIGVAWASRAVS